jgi:hypothetical protein
MTFNEIDFSWLPTYGRWARLMNILKKSAFAALLVEVAQVIGEGEHEVPL